MFIQPSHLLLSALAHWVNREQAAVIDYLREENRVLRDRLGPKRLRFTDAERRRLAARAKLVCRNVRREIGSPVTPDTLMRWHRQLIAKKYDGRPGKVGRPTIGPEIATLVVRIARENPAWGYTRIRGALWNIGHEVGRNTIAQFNAYAERFVRSINEECLSRMIFFSEKQLRTAVGQFVEHYHSERNHQGLANRLIEPELERDNGTGKVICESRLGGLLNHYMRAA